jgi:2'-5' RNA ligase
LGRVGFFPHEEFIRIIWVELISDELSELAKNIHAVISPYIRLEERSFVSHITIAHAKRIFDKQKLIKAVADIVVNPVCFQVDEFTLKKSELTDRGSFYYDVQHYALQPL